MNKPNAKYDHGYAIVRIDGPDAVVDEDLNAITILKVLRTEQKAKEEVRRLNTLKRGKGARYLSVITRIEREDTSRIE